MAQNAENVIDDIKLYSIFSKIPLDINGSNLDKAWYTPNEEDAKYMDMKDYLKLSEEVLEKNAKVLFTNVELQWDSCDCSDYGCSHGKYVYEMKIKSGDKTHTVEVDDSGVLIYYNERQACIPQKDVTAYDFYRMCEMVGVKLELSDYAKSLLT